MILRSMWFWTFIIGLGMGMYAGYHVGLVSGYEEALNALKRVVPGIP